MRHRYGASLESDTAGKVDQQASRNISMVKNAGTGRRQFGICTTPVESVNGQPIGVQ